jgi:serine/threonine-protein kinase
MPLKGTLPIETAIDYANQILEALDAAHRKGIIHRDLKPDNILVTKQGIKLLDFGLAKRANLFQDSDATQALTMHGQIAGTLQYMSPEQLQGYEIDTRSDLFAFGCVLYEMLSGRRAFQGETAASVVAAILEREPAPLSAAPPLDRVVRRSVAKDPDQRFQTARDLKAALAWAMEQPPPVVAAKPNRLRWNTSGVAGGIVLLLVGITIERWLHSSPANPHPQPVSRWTVPLAASDPLNGFGIAISRDGKRMAYAERSSGSSRIVVRNLDQMEVRPIAGTEGGLRPFFSPDGYWLAYFTGLGGSIKKVPVTGGTPTTLCENAGYYGGSWDENNQIVFCGVGGMTLMHVSASGGRCEVLSEPDKSQGETSRRWPQALPDGHSLLLTAGTGGSFDNAHIAVLDMNKRTSRVVVRGGSAAPYVSSGHLVYVRAGTMFAVPFDLKSLSVTGPEVPVLEGVFYNTSGGFSDYSFSNSGLLLYMMETRLTNRYTFDWVDRSGVFQKSSIPPQIGPTRMALQGSDIRLSPDGLRAAVTLPSLTGGVDIYVADLTRGALSRLTSEGTSDHPIWTPDGTHVAFGSRRREGLGIYWVPADGSSKPELLLPTGDTLSFPSSWTADGKTLLYTSTGPARIWSFTLSGNGGDGKPRKLFETSAPNESEAQVSPDGHWVAYVSDESGRSQVYARPFPGPGGKVAISIETGEDPRWSGDGREIFYFDPARSKVMAVKITAGTTLQAGAPQSLFEQALRDWDVAPDGKRFLARRIPLTEPNQAKMQVVFNWLEELRQARAER